MFRVGQRYQSTSKFNKYIAIINQVTPECVYYSYVVDGDIKINYSSSILSAIQAHLDKGYWKLLGTPTLTLRRVRG